MTDRRILVLRFWLLAAAALLLTVFWPGLALYLFAGFAWVPLGLFMPPVFGGQPGCGWCPDNAAMTYQVVITGVTNANAECGDCDTNYNGTFVLPYFATIPGFQCTWRFNVNFCCGAAQGNVDRMIYTISITGDSLIFLDASANPRMVWDQDLLSGDHSTCIFTNRSLPFVSDASTGCDATAATCLVTAL